MILKNLVLIKSDKVLNRFQSKNGIILKKNFRLMILPTYNLNKAFFLKDEISQNELFSIIALKNS